MIPAVTTSDWLALAGIAITLLGTAWTLLGVFAPPGWMTSARNEEARRNMALSVARGTKDSYAVPPYAEEEARKARQEADQRLADDLMKVAGQVDADRAKDSRSAQRFASLGLLLVAIGSLLQGAALLKS